ncbi:hypothetical protein MPSEU_001061200 [Mayamaea pseudoterrestris]|nr:hypothetical protein MPSEU_001061200 [Mayamaea pseudoterrestris]
MDLDHGSLVVLLRLGWFITTVAILFKVAIILSRWWAFYLDDDELTQAIQGFKTLMLRGRKEAELLLSGDYGRRVAMGYVFQDLSRFSEGQSYLNVYFRRRAKAASERAMAEWEDRRPTKRAAS